MPQNIWQVRCPGCGDANCQTMVNLLVQRIAKGSEPYTPYRTLSHALGSGPTRQNLFVISEFDEIKPTKLSGKSTLEPPDWNRLHSKSVLSRSATNQASNNKEDLIDLDRAVRLEGPLKIDELRSDVYAWSRGPTSRSPEYNQPPPVSLPPGYFEWIESQSSKTPSTADNKADLVFEAAPRSIYIQYENTIKRYRDIQIRDEGMKPWFVPTDRREAKKRERRKSRKMGGYEARLRKYWRSNSGRSSS